MRSLFGILLLFCLSAPIVGTYTGLHVEKYRVKKAVKQRLLAEVNPADLVFFQFSKIEQETVLHWEHEQEFEYHGQMYDVVRKVVRNDSVLLWCWWDHAETKLNRQLRHILAQTLSNDPCRRDQERRAVCFFLALFFVEIPDVHLVCRDSEYFELPERGLPLPDWTVPQPPAPPPDVRAC